MPVLDVLRRTIALAPIALLAACSGGGGGGGGGGGASPGGGATPAVDLAVSDLRAGAATKEGDRLGAVSAAAGSPVTAGSTARFSITNAGGAATNAQIIVSLHSGPAQSPNPGGPGSLSGVQSARGNRMFDFFTIASGFAPGASIDAGVAAVLDGAEVPLFGFRDLPVVLKEGQSVLSIVVDTTNALGEANLVNNQAFESGSRAFSAVVGGIDLVAAEALTTSNNGVITPGVEFVTNVSMANVGDASAGFVPVAVFAILPGGGQQLLGSSPGIPLLAGGQGTVAVRCTLPAGAAVGAGEGQVFAAVGFDTNIGAYLLSDPSIDNNVSRERVRFTS